MKSVLDKSPIKCDKLDGKCAILRIVLMIIIIGFLVVRINSVLGSTTVSSTIDHGSHDAEYEIQADYFDHPAKDTVMYIQTSSNDIMNQLNFLDVGVPANQTIDQAILKINVGTEQGSSSSYARSVTIYGVNDITLSNMTSVGDMSSSYTSEHTIWGIAHLTTGWHDIDVTDIIRELASDASWSSTSDVGFIILGAMYSDTRYVNCYEGGVPAQLQITYREPNTGTEYRGYYITTNDPFDIIGIDHQYKPTVLSSTSYTNRSVSYDDTDIWNSNHTEPWYNGTFPDGMFYDGYYEGYVNYLSPLMNGFGAGLGCNTIQDLKAIPRNLAPVGTYAIGDVTGASNNFEFAYLMAFTAVSGSYSGWSVKQSNAVPAVGLSLEKINGTHMDIKADHNGMMSAWNELTASGYMVEDEVYIVVAGLSNPPPAQNYQHQYWASVYHLNNVTGAITYNGGCSAVFNMSSSYDGIVDDIEYINNQNGGAVDMAADINFLAGYYPNQNPNVWTVKDEDGNILNSTCLSSATTLEEVLACIDASISQPFYEGSGTGSGWDASGLANQIGLIIGIIGILVVSGSIFMCIGSLQSGDFSTALTYFAAGIPIGYALILAWLGG